MILNTWYATTIGSPTRSIPKVKQKITEIWRIWPLLEHEIEKANFGKDYVDLFFKNGSTFSIVGALDSDRGLRNHSGLIDEARKFVLNF